ncbi:MAG: hypothetical protein R3B54_16005 [Bdellovibrionota bacterium]
MGSLLGFGSINFVLGVDFEDPENASADPIEAAVRAMHENVAGQIRNESQVWRRATDALVADSDKDISMVGVYLQDALSASMETLGPGGSEVDLERDRELITQAAQVYRREADETRSGFAIRTVPVIEKLQKKVQADMQKSMSVHPRIKHVRMDQHAQARDLSTDALDLEFENAYQVGAYDRDGHPGNWMVDDLHQILYRTDVSQFRVVAPDVVAAQRDALRVLIKPILLASDRQKLVSLTGKIFDCGTVPEATVALHFRRLLQAYGTPYANPIKNLYFYRRKLTEALQKATGNAALALKFQSETVSYIQTIARNRIHEESAGRWRLYRGLGRSVGDGPIQSALQFAGHGIKACAKAIAGQAE